MRYWSVVLLFVASTAVAQDWRQVANLEHSGVLFVDVSDIADVKGYRRAWFRWTYGSDQPIPNEYRESVPKSETYRWLRSANLFHCTQQIAAVAEQRWFNAMDVELGSRQPDTVQFHKVSPDSVEQQMLEAVCKSEYVRTPRREDEAQITHSADPVAFYPASSLRRGEQGKTTVKACVDSTGKLLREPEVTGSSGFQTLDGAAIRVAKNSRYKPGVRDGAALPESCLEFAVTFRHERHVPEDAARASMAVPANPSDFYRGHEKGSPVVEACVGSNGKLIRDPVIVETSGSPELDAAAIGVAKASKYKAASIGGVRLPESCIKYKVKFGRPMSDGELR